MQGHKGKPTIEQRISFWVRGHNKYHVSRKPDQGNRIPQPGILSSITDAGARGWGDSKNFDAYEPVSEASSSLGMVKFSGLGRAKSMFISLTYSLHASDSKRKQSDLSDTNISKDEGKLGSKPKLKIVRSGKPLEPFVLPMEDSSSCVKISEVDVVIPATPIPVTPIQSIMPLPQDELPVRVCEPSIKKGESDDVNFKEGPVHVPLPSRSQCFPSIRLIPSFGKDLFDSRLRLVDSQGVCSPDDDDVESIRKINASSPVPHPQRPWRAPQGAISTFKADAVIKEVDKNTARVFGKAILDKVCRTPFDGLPSLKSDFDSLYATIIQRGVDVTPLKNKVKGSIKQTYLSSHVAASEHLLQEAEREVIDLQGQIDILNATEVMDASTKASLDKAEAYINESFEDLKNFQWDP
ncbi:hypothetical protein Cgig2_000225 [Carnegiea gigantea]|uniref:Uncharacterized protein n=1 Tax=Carnegiea gigantea TaxID=171969 RepID=A0A9Q1Q654_9CARY|nr:hypothetical protein Cgig2_000225 [Carnegiea gigantea]